MLLGFEFAGIKQVQRYLNKLVAEDADNDDNDIDSYTTSVIEGLRKFLHLSENDLNIFQTIELAKRCAFVDAIKDRFDNVKEKISRHVEIYKLNHLTEELLPILHDLCYFDFSRHRLSFASTVIDQLNTLEQYEQKLLKIIQRMRDETHVNDALNTEYDALKNCRKKIVLAVMGCAKSTKSSFINYLLGEKVCPVDKLSTTARVTRIIYGYQRKVYLEGEEGEEMDNIDSLYRKATELIGLKGDNRNDETKCKIKVIIELPIKQLKNIELWDLPGLNENPALDKIVSTILPDVDLVFALLPIDGGVSFDFLNNINICLTHNRNSSGLINETHDNDLYGGRFQRQVCFVITKIDSVASNNQADKPRDITLQELSTTVLERMKSELNIEMNLEDVNPMSSPRFISMCTNSAHLKDFLHCQEEFYQKSATFFKSALNDIMHRRLDYLLQTIYELLDYDDIDCTINSCEQLLNIINERQQNLEDNLKTKLSIHFEPIGKHLYSQVANLSNDWSAFRILSANKRDWSAAVETIMKTPEMSMETHSAAIQQSATEAIDNFFVTLDLHPNQRQLVKQAMNRTFLDNPYRIIIGQHEIEAAPNRIRELSWAQVESIPGNKISKILRQCLTPFRFLNNLRQATRETLTNMTESNVQKVIDQCLNNTIRVINLSILEQVGKILGEIEAKKQTMLKGKNILEVDVVAKFISNNEQSITKLYLDIQNHKSCAEYSFFKIFNEKLGSRNSSVYAALLATDNHSEIIPIAAKIVNLQEFCCQELRYMNNNHQNIVKLYGVQLSDKNDEYYILMEKLDCNLYQYLLENKNNLLDAHIDKMIMQIVNGLHYLHDLPLIHRGIRPANVLVRKCEPPVFLINGFRFLRESSPSTDDTSCYTAPELKNTDSLINDPARPTVDRFVCGYVGNNSLTAKTDIYALGVTIAEIYEKSNLRRHGQYYRFWNSMANRCRSDACAKRPTCKEILAERLNYVEETEVARTAASNNTLTLAQENFPSCGGNVCIYCRNCRDWIYDDDVDSSTNHELIVDKRRWHRSPEAKCFYGNDHFPPYYDRPAGDSIHDDGSIRFYNRILMKVCIETTSGMAQIYKLDVDPSMTIKQLKELFLKQMNNNKDLETICFVINEEELEYDDHTLSDYRIEDESILQLFHLNANSRSDISFLGTKFANVSNSKGLKKIQWSKTAPPWRGTKRGLCLEGLCTNEQCKAYKQSIIIPIGYKKFDIVIDPNEDTTKFPICQSYVGPSTCSFNNCWWKYQGIKQNDEGQGKPLIKCSNDWQKADNAYYYFDQDKAGIVIWKQQIVEAARDKPSN